MFRRCIAATCMLLVFGVALVAAEIKTRIVKVDAPNRKITVTIGEKEQELTLTEDAKILGPKGQLKDGLKHKVFQNGKALKKGIRATHGLSTDAGRALRLSAVPCLEIVTGEGRVLAVAVHISLSAQAQTVGQRQAWPYAHCP